jgi:hypothetical protein
MASRSELLPQDRREWLLAIGQRLRAEYAAVGDPIPERLAALVARLEAPAAPAPANAGPAASPAASPAAEAHVAPDQEPAPECPSPPLHESRGQSSRLELR